SSRLLADLGHCYFFGINGSSTMKSHALVCFFVLTVACLTMWILILPLLERTGRLMRQRNDCRLKARLVTRRHVHVTKLGVRRHETAPSTHGYERAVSALLPRVQPIEPLSGAFAPRFAAVVDVSRGQRLVAGEPRAGVERSVGADGVSVLHVHVARSARHAARRREAALLRLAAQEAELVVERAARIAAAAFARRRHARTAQRLALTVDRHEREHALRRRRRRPADRLE